ncbi:hypothetical protein EFQ99_25405 [Rhizobium vallis]|uniref:SnoaL-like domain-containing protein n=1 Tax=Rhizobium vallis TaxID=634290 RepID=A0A432PF02_9HYPH|nr:nuclear transport factor 2 family protein [Rhizobium vallis]RUM22225.1 hypothetical protein EFQ99_25405 [Rhizobium vallis]
MTFGKSLVALAILAAIAAPSGAFAESTARDLKVEEANRKLVVEFYDRFFNKHDIEAASVIADDYRQHNPQVPDGKKPLISFFSGFFKDNAQSKAEIVRSAADGDLVWLHVHATNGANDRGESIVDIFRVKDGKIVEHWDVIQSVPKEAANKNTMF